MADFKVLGWCSDRKLIYYQHRQTGQIAYIAPSAQAAPLLKLAPLDMWETLFPGRFGTDWTAATSNVIESANAAGVFALERVRGRGLWMDGSKVVWHLGDRLEVDGKPIKLIDFDSAFYYQRLPRLTIDAATAPLSDAQGQEILKAVKAMGWSSPLDHLHLLGWIALANVGGALDKRPVLQITCGFGQGKTYIITVVTWPLLAGLAISHSNSTEAAIRQTLNTDTLPVLIDESEGEDRQRREGHLKLARLSFDGVATSRGTTHGKALTYAVRSSIALVGINATVPNPADRSRVVVVGRQTLPEEQWGPVDRKLRQLLTVDTGAQLLRRTVTNLPTLLANVATFRRVVEAQLPAGAAARAGDTYGALLAGAHLLLSTAQVDEAQAIAWLDCIGWDAAAALGVDAAPEQSSAAEGGQCLATLLSHEEQWRTADPEYGTGKLTIRELLELARSLSGADEAEQARKALGRRGIKATDHALVIANSAELLAPIYGNTKWRNGGHRERLRDLPGADTAGSVHFKVVGTQKATTVPWAAARI
jgi:putative DNA primase/helicase